MTYYLDKYFKVFIKRILNVFLMEVTVYENSEFFQGEQLISSSTSLNAVYVLNTASDT